MLAAITVAAWISERRTTFPTRVESGPRVWLDSRDQNTFAGQWVAVDRETNEFLAHDEDRAAVDVRLCYSHPERYAVVFRCPEDPRDPIHVDLPCAKRSSLR